VFGTLTIISSLKFSSKFENLIIKNAYTEKMQQFNNLKT
jgi:hypothetical protein